MDDQTKLTMQSQDLSDLKFAQLQALFPQVFTEAKDEGGNTIRAINTELLEQEINTKVLDGKKERYEFTWPDKRQAIRMANTPTNAALRPCREESVDFDTTENLYIEGDNLEVLKLLRETYLNKVKMIYIDPPYNTGKDFVYRDNFTESVDSFRERDGQYDEQGNRLVTNLESNGRFHTDWLNMMYPRLKIARDMLTDDGVIFISIDDNEVHNLRKICDEVFGEANFIAQICHKSRASISNDKVISPNHNIILFFAKNIIPIEQQRKTIGLDPVLDGFNSDDNDGRGPYRLVPVDGPGGAKKGNPFYEFLGVEGYWRFSKTVMQEKYEGGLVVKRGNSLYQKYFKTLAAKTRRTDTTWWDDGGLTSSATSKLKNLMDGPVFDTPKPVELIYRMLKLVTSTNKNSFILDFFSGSSTTAHAVMQLNAEDGGKRKFIMVQLPEETPENSPARSAGFETISDIGKERIRRAGRKIKEESPITTTDLDVGFRVLKLASSNMKEVFYTPDETLQTDLSFDGLVNNIKEDRSDEDLLFQVMLELGIPLSSKIEKRDGVFYVEGTYLIACFQAVDNEQIKEIAQKEPYYVVFRDSSFANDSDSINFGQIFATYSPHTKRRVL